jgi:hypothetical protein
MNWLKRIFPGLRFGATTRPKTGTASEPELPTVTAENRAEVLAEVDAYVRRQVAAGFRGDAEIIDGASEYLGDQWRPEDVRRLAAGRVREFAIAQQASEKSWSGLTDCDRLDRAFAALEARGVVCRQDFACCGNCGHAEIGDEIEATREKGRPVHGYAFYHMQDTDRAVDGAGVYLAYGSAEGGDAEAAKVAQEICAALREEGLEPQWNGSVEQRVFVPLEWKRRRRPTCVRR